MKIAVIGTGNIGSELARALASAGHSLALANSRGPESIRELADELHARAVTVTEAVERPDVVVLSIPFSAIPGLTQTLREAPGPTIFVDMSNYYPLAGVIEGVEDADSDTAWLSRETGLSFVKAWNTLFSRSLALKRRAVGEPDRVALPVAGDDPAAKQIVMQLVEDTGFEAVDAGTLADSWRMQPGSPAYCTDLDATALQSALARADRARIPQDRDAEIRAVYNPDSGIDMVNGVQIYRDITS